MYKFIIIIILFLLFYLYRKEHFINNNTIRIKKIFRTPKEQMKGLMFMKKIESDVGYMFYYNPPNIASFWMKNTFVPLDIIFIDKHNRIVYLIEGMVPHDTTSRGYPKKIRYVIEIKSGYIKKYNLKHGMKIQFNYL